MTSYDICDSRYDDWEQDECVRDEIRVLIDFNFRKLLFITFVCPLLNLAIFLFQWKFHKQLRAYSILEKLVIKFDIAWSEIMM